MHLFFPQPRTALRSNSEFQVQLVCLSVCQTNPETRVLSDPPEARETLPPTFWTMRNSAGTTGTSPRMKLMFHLRSVKNPWWQIPIRYIGLRRRCIGAKSRINLAEGPFFGRCRPNAVGLARRPATEAFCYHLFTLVPRRVGNRRRICGVQLSERHSRG
jgi:hypothetical protein